VEYAALKNVRLTAWVGGEEAEGMSTEKLMCGFGMNLTGHREQGKSFISVKLGERMRIKIDDSWR